MLELGVVLVLILLLIVLLLLSWLLHLLLVTLRVGSHHILLNLLLGHCWVSCIEHVINLGVLLDCLMVLVKVHLTTDSSLVDEVLVVLLCYCSFFLFLFVRLFLVSVLLLCIIFKILLPLKCPFFDYVVLVGDEFVLQKLLDSDRPLLNNCSPHLLQWVPFHRDVDQARMMPHKRRKAINVVVDEN